MHRSASTNRIWDGHLSYHSSKPAAELDGELPIYDPFSDAAKKEKAGARFVGNAVHVIPFILLFCAFVLWFFSNPDVEVNGTSLLAEKILSQTIEADLDSDGTVGHLPLDLGDLDPIEVVHSKTSISSNERSG